MPKKIFELAKELELGALDLVEKLKAEGFNVRNHMNSLSDEEVEKAMALLKKPEEKKTTKKKTAVRKKAKKKTAAKKKTTASKKVVTTKEAAKKDEGEEVPKDKKKKVTKRKKTLIRRKSPAKKVSEEETAATEAVEMSTDVDSGAADTGSPLAEGDKDQGLRIVAKPRTEQAAETEAGQEVAKKLKPGDKLFKEKVHTFTPVYIPTKEELEEQERQKEENKVKAEQESAEKAPQAGGAASKKRMGDLAAIVSGKKNINRAKSLTEYRANEEMKTYATLSTLGRPLYKQIGKKKNYSGPSQSTQITETKESKRVVQIHQGSTVKDLAIKLSIKPKEFADKMLDMNLLVKEEDYVRTARGKGLKEMMIQTRHILRNALIPVVTYLGLLFADLLGGTVFIESVFARPGLGRFAINAISARDFPQVQGLVLFIASFYVIMNLLVDLLYGIIDPRIRFAE